MNAKVSFSVGKPVHGVCALALMIALLLSAVAGAETPPASQQDTGEFLPVATVHEIMESMMAPAAEAVWDSVAFISTREYTIDSKPETDEDWQKLRWQAVIIAEAANALLVPGRRVGLPGVVSDDPEHELDPDETQAMIENNREAWVAYAHGVHAQAMETIRVIDAKDVEGLSDVGGSIDAACEACHLHFWYPE
jgi:cytochrome c556